MRARVVSFAAAMVFLAMSDGWAGVPDPGHSVVPGFINVVGYAEGVPDPAGAFSIEVRDINGVACAGVPVALNFSNCSDLRLALVQPPGVTLSCVDYTLTATTSTEGVATFTVIGACAFDCLNGNGPGAGLNAVKVCADGIQIGELTAAVFDHDGAANGDGVTVVDGDIVRYAVLSFLAGGTYVARADLDFDGTLSGSDIQEYWQKAFVPAAFGEGSRDGSDGGGFCSPPSPTVPCP